MHWRDLRIYGHKIIRNETVKKGSENNKKCYQLAKNIIWTLEQPNERKSSLFVSYSMSTFMYTAETWTKNKAYQ
jgi:hypothetical protein